MSIDSAVIKSSAGTSATQLFELARGRSPCFKRGMPHKTQYVQLTDVKYQQLEIIDVPAIVASNQAKWFNQALTEINDSVARLAIIEGEYHWHKHDNEDEFFFVLSGQLLIDIEGHTLELNPHQGVTIPRGVMHRTRALTKTVMLVVENKTTNLLGE